MFSPRWRKVARDLAGNKVRTLLVVLSIAVGVFAVGLIAGANLLLSRGMTEGYSAINPASAVLFTDPFDEALVHVIRRMPGVKDAEGRRTVRVGVQVGEDDWRPMTLTVVADFDEIRVDQIRHEAGAWDPSFREMVLERASVGMLGKGVGDRVRVEAAEGRIRELSVIGLAHDLNQFPTPLSGTAYGYINFATLEWLGWSRYFNELHLLVDGTADQVNDREYIRRIAGEVAAKIERSGRTVHFTWIGDPGRHPAEEVIQPLVAILGVLGFLALVMSGFLVANTMAAILTQHVRQIGVMKAVGARTLQLVAMYLGMVFAFSFAALLLGIPLAFVGARGVATFVAGLANFDILRYELGAGVLLLQIGVGLVVPLLAAVQPVYSGVKKTVREAISDHGPAQAVSGRSLFDRALERVRGLSRPLLLSLRNTFRRKGRLVMTLVTLTLGGAIFVAVMSVHESLLLTLDEVLRYWNYDVGVAFERAYRVELIEEEAMKVPGVIAAESWGGAAARLKRPDGTFSESYQVIAPPAETRMILPEIVAGRWLHPEDENALVINADVLKEEPSLRVGDVVTLKMSDRESVWHIVGTVPTSLSGPIAYANYDYFSREMRRVGRATNVQVNTVTDDPAELNRIASALKEHFEGIGLRVRATETIAQVREPIVFQFNILVAFMLIMATLLAVVGALGLTGTMSINVLERIREIGVMRAIGASSGSIMRMVIVEGCLIALISWVLGGLLAVPLSRFLCYIVGMAFIQTPLSYSFAGMAVVYWLGILLALAAGASLLPAWNAARLTVRDVLAYE